MTQLLACGNRFLDLSHPHVMGVLNVTPDSFYDGGSYKYLDQALAQAEKMVKEGASIIDVGGESTRPGAKPVSVAEELDRVIPVVEKITQQLDVVVSVDTSTPVVITEAENKGAGLINDVRALQCDGALQAAANTSLPICLMHMQGEPGSMQENPYYSSVVDDVKQFLLTRIKACEAIGISRSRLILDPGFGFGKTVEHNFNLAKHLADLKKLELPILIGVSRKSMIGAILNKDVDDRLYGTLAVNLWCYLQGGSIFRVHDVAASVDCLKLVQAIQGAN
ncbi:dihydropteroate synthase [Endozoicomonas sp. SM1973]|uniref:Dihydropteroate synthase n=1 Tax=Spartinivicinus marinus TaxID=2994442 RepID=A0A853IDX3_9GAMM|nr:dihydropteroate synthase [Spartinivicinus marinus]MCX4027978.1 dihydropteroate synthase [Spartinivicinus marinus]NYZ68254.1 dihydropteroate synthase [Spartinivicinus marinus]